MGCFADENGKGSNGELNEGREEKMSEMDKYYQILGLNPGASKKEIKEAYRDLVKVWHPDRFSDSRRLREKATERLKDINFPYKKLMEYSETFESETAQPGSEDDRSYERSQPPPHEPPPKPEEERTNKADKGHDYSQPPPKTEKEQSSTRESEGYKESFTQKPQAHSSWIPLIVLFVFFGLAIIGVLLQDHIPTSSPPSSSQPPETGLTAMDWYNKGQSLQQSGNYKEAIDAYSRVVDLDAQFSKVYAYRGCAYYRLGDFQQAIRDCSKAIEIDPQDATAYHYRGTAFYMKGQYDEAIDDLSKAITTDANHPEAYYSYIYRALAFSKKRQTDEALEDFNKAISINPNGAGAYVGRRWAFLSKYTLDEAIEDYNKVILVSPDDAASYDGGGFTSYKKGEYDKAVEDFNKAIHINPNHQATYYNRGYAYLELGENQLATADFQKSIELNKNRDFITRNCYIGLSIACFRQNKIEDVKANYQKAIEIEPLCKNGLDAVEKREGFFYTPGQKQTVKEILKLF